MSNEWCTGAYSIRNTLLSSLTRIHARGKLHLNSRLPWRQPCLIGFFWATSRDGEASRTLNSLARGGLALLGTSNSSAVSDFLHDFFAENDPGNETPEQKHCALLYPMVNWFYRGIGRRSQKKGHGKKKKINKVSGRSLSNLNGSKFRGHNYYQRWNRNFLKNPICRVLS